VLAPALAGQLLPLCAELWNLHGPTEATVWASAWRVAAAEAISLGSPLPGTRLALVDQTGSPIGEAERPGKITIYGQGLATSYLGQAELTRERFTDLMTPEGLRRCYRTGTGWSTPVTGSSPFSAATMTRLSCAASVLNWEKLNQRLKSTPR
jgi:non-ribosomal peptide synthetase component F